MDHSNFCIFEVRRGIWSVVSVGVKQFGLLDWGQRSTMVTAEPPANEENGDVEPSFSDTESYVDSANEEDLVGDILHKKPSINEYEQCCVIISNIPIVGEEKLPKLKNVLSKVFVRIHEKFTDFYPQDKDGKTKGYCFVEYPSKEIAENAAAVFDGYVLDKNFTFSANLFCDLHKFKEPDPKWVAPQPQPYVPKGDLWSWLQNEKCYDQFAVLYDKEVVPQDKKGGSYMSPHLGVYDFKKGQDPQLAKGNSERQSWTESIFLWSPYGTFIASIHAQGVCLWGGEKFDRFMRFQHQNVIYIDFSPCERYLVTYSPPESRWGDDPNSLRIFDVQTGEMRCGFSLVALLDLHQLPGWPLFQWSYDEAYMACPKPGGNGISVFETEHFTLLDKKPITIEALRSFKWSPTRPVIAYYCEERTANDAPAEIGVMEIPSKQKLRAQRVFSVSDAELFWNKNGDRLAAHTERYQKKNVKSTSSGEDVNVKYSKPSSHIEIFDVRAKDVSVLSMPLSDSYVGFGWEPIGDKFCVLVGNQHKTTPLVFYLDPSKHLPQLISKFEPSERFTTVSWAPAGGWLVVYSENSAAGGIMFIDTNGNEPTRTMFVEYSGSMKGSWDPTGRYFAAASTLGGGGRSGAGGGDTGYRIFTFQGKELCQKSLDRMMQFRWRPRPPVKLPEETVKMVRRNLKATSARFEEEDKRERGRASQEVIEKRRKVMKEFNQNRVQHKAIYEKEASLRLQLRGGNELADAEEDLVEETITVPLTTERVKILEKPADEE